MDREKVIKEIEDALSDDLAKACYIYGLSLNGLKDKALTDVLALLKEQKIAMKPKNIDKVGGNCPVCGLRMARSNKYCSQCRQEMEWEC